MLEFPLPALTPVLAAGEPAGVALSIVEEAVEEAAQIRAAAHEEGFAAGREAGLAELATAVEAVRSAAAAVLAERDAVAPGAEAAACELGLAIADQVLGGALEARPELVLETVRGALRTILDRHQVTVFVHPDDLPLVREGIGQVLGELGGVDHCDVQAERRLAPGGAVVSTREGSVDASLATKLARVREVLLEELSVAEVAAGA